MSQDVMSGKQKVLLAFWRRLLEWTFCSVSALHLKERSCIQASIMKGCIKDPSSSFCLGFVCKSGHVAGTEVVSIDRVFTLSALSVVLFVGVRR